MMGWLAAGRAVQAGTLAGGNALTEEGTPQEPEQTEALAECWRRCPPGAEGSVRKDTLPVGGAKQRDPQL